jgi:GAF domain-containing protein
VSQCPPGRHTGPVTVPDASSLAELTDLARLQEGDEEIGRLLDRLVRRAPELVPGCAGAALTITGPAGGENAAVSDPRVGRCHAVQFRPGGEGPASEALQYAEPRRVDDVDQEQRWPQYCDVARREGVASCLALPLLTDRVPTAALNLYAEAPCVFAGRTHDVALLFAAQGVHPSIVPGRTGGLPGRPRPAPSG